MKKLFVLLLMVPFLGLFTSCDKDDDSYSLNNAWIGFGLVKKDDSSGALSVAMDNGQVLLPIANAGLISNAKNDNRILLNYTVLGDKASQTETKYYYVKINSVRKILYKGILDITPAIQDSIGNDPIYVKDKWLKNDILNFELQYRGGNKVHFINLVKTPGEINPDEPVLLELRHNANSDDAGLPFSSFVSFDLSALKVQGKNSTKFKVTAKGFEGKDFEFTGEYKY